MEVGDRLLTVVRCQQGNQAGINVRAWRVSRKTQNGVSLDQIAAYFDINLSTPYKNWLANTATYEFVTAQQYFPTLSSTATRSANKGAGVGGATPAPRQVSGLVTWQTVLGGRKNRGRTYLPFPASSHFNPPDTLNTNALLLANQIANAYLVVHTIIAGVDANDLTPIIEHRPLGSGFIDINFGFARDKAATQRRRGPFGRPNELA